MELVKQFKESGYFTADLFSLLTKKKVLKAEKELTPSEYEREMRMGTAERLQALNNIEIDNLVGKDKSKAALSFTPKIIVYQNFEPNKKVLAKFTVQNKSKASTCLNMVNEESLYFFVKASGEQPSRLAPGIGLTFTVTFLPEQYKDYLYEIIFYTDTEQYVFPVIAIGPKAIFNFPDKVVIPPGPLKVINHTTLTIQNVGKVSSGLTFNTKSPFLVQPKTLSLNPNERIDVRIGLQTMHPGDTEGVLNAILETGEIFFINLSGSKYQVSIELEKPVVRFSDTFNTLQRQQTIKILNKSNHLLSYTCMKNDCFSKDFEDKLKLTNIFHNVKEIESLKSNKLIYYDISSSDEHERVYTRIYCDEIEALAVDESLFFKHPHFSIAPLSGTIWANSSAELSVTFSPNEIGDLEAITYLDVDGVANRIPLKMTGLSLPPLITLNLQTLDVDRIYIKNTYNYEIVAMNKGHINGTIIYVEHPTLFGGNISCKTKKLCLRPGEMDIFVLSFCSSKQGSFFEEIHFHIRDSPEVIKVYLRGTIVYPSLAFSLPLINFGHVCLGVPKTLQLEVINESKINVNASLIVPTDGTEMNSITLENYALAGYPKPKLAHCPKEFIIEPKKISIKPESSVNLEITLTANMVRECRTRLEVELDESESLPITLPITFNATVPAIVKVPDLILDACVLDFPYKHVLDIKCSNITGYFSLYESEAQSKIKIDAEVKEGFIKPKTILKLPISVTAVELGLKKVALRFNIFGLSDPVHVCYVTATGVPPTVTCSTSSLTWGQIKLLMMKDKSLTLYNLSPIVIPFTVHLAKNDDKLNIKPSKGQIEPESEIVITFGLYLVDANNYSNKAIIQMKNVRDLIIPLTATGVGTSVMIGELRDRVDLGKHFTKLPFHCKVTMQNFGTRIHSLEWSDFYKLAKPSTFRIQETKMFNLQPKTWKMLAGEKVDLTITGTFNKAMTVDETWYLVGCVEGINKKELLTECQICATFVDPEIILSPLTIDFRYDYGPYNEYYKLIDTITIKNITTLPLDLEITTKPPFAIVKKSSSYKIYPYEKNVSDCYINNSGDNGSKKTDLELRYSRVFMDCVTRKHNVFHNKSSLSLYEDINKIKETYELVYIVEEQLEHQEIMKLQVLFDTSVHTSVTSRIYRDLLRVRLKGHKNKDAVELVGEINHPNISVLAHHIDFQCILNKSVTSKLIKIQNLSPLLVCYKLKWKEHTITAEPVHKDKKNINSGVPPMSINNNNFGTYENLYENNTDNYMRNNQTLSHNVHDGNNMMNKVLAKIAPIMLGAYDTKFHRRATLSQKVNRNIEIINRILQLVPNGGLLKPNDIQEVHVIFTPADNISITALLECVVQGGPSTYVSIVGRSAELSYFLSSRSINFKIRSFYESAFEKIIISNKAILPFQFNTYLNEPKNNNELSMTICNVKPKVKRLEPFEEIEISVEIEPGLMGYFKRSFTLEVGHLPPMLIDVYGWGVIPQVYLNLPRCQSESDLELQYAAISTLNLKYVDAVKELFGSATSKHLNSPHTEKCFQDVLFDENWHICSVMEEFPSTLDIDLAIERELVSRYLKQNPNLIATLKMSGKQFTITGVDATPYLLDFGVVTNGAMTSKSVDVINYGPNTTKLSISRKTIVPPNLIIKLCGKINSGEIGKIEIIYTPNVSNIDETEQKFEAQIAIEVPYGVSIPLQIKALCALPYLYSKVKSVYFGSVRCGDKIFYTIPLKNIGAPPCVWYATVKVKTKGPNPLKLETTSGIYEPGEGGLFRIAFAPIVEAKFEAILVFTFHMNPNKLSIHVGGKGVIPRLVVIGPKVTFSPTLPYANTAHNYFGITNPCPFPVELIFAHTDVQWKEDEEIYKLLSKYYDDLDEILIPIQKPATGLPTEIISFYTKYKEGIKRLKEEHQQTQSPIPEHPKKTKSNKSLVDKPVTSPLSPVKLRSDSEIARDVIQNMKAEKLDPLGLQLKEDNNIMYGNDKQSAKGVLLLFHGPPCLEMECQEIAYSVGKLLNIPAVTIDNCVVEALCTCVCAARSTLLCALNDLYAHVSPHQAEGGEESSDQMECQEIAYSVGKLLNIPAVTIDNCVVEALCTCVCAARSTLLCALNDLYAHVSPHQAEGGEESSDLEETDDDFDIIWKKIEHTIQTLSRTTLPPELKHLKKKDKELKLGALNELNTTSILDLDVVQELLIEYFNQPKYDRGFIVVSLNNRIIKRPEVALAMVLKCKPIIRTIRLLLCHTSFAKWTHYQESKRTADLLQKKEALKEYTAEEISQIIENFEKKDGVEYDTSDPDLREIYIKYGLEDRRKKYYEKHIVKPIESVTKSKKSLFVKVVRARSQSTKEEPAKVNPAQEVRDSSEYNEYVNSVFAPLVSVASNWLVEDGDLALPLYSLGGLTSCKQGGKKKTKIQAQISETSLAKRGFPLIIINSPCLIYKETIKNMFLTCGIVQKALSIEKFDVLEVPASRRDCSILLPRVMPLIKHEDSLEWRVLTEKPREKCECNEVPDILNTEHYTQEEVLKILSHWECKCEKSVKYPRLLKNDSTSTDAELRRRIVLHPGELLRCEYTFSPRAEGRYSARHYVEVSGWPPSRLEICASGVCDLPRLDTRPKKMFEKFVRHSIADHPYKGTFLDDKKILELGNIFVGNKRVFEEKYAIMLRNSSLMDSIIEADILGDRSTFRIIDNIVQLQASSKCRILVQAAPKEVGKRECTLLLCIRDNPEIVAVSVSCTGIPPVMKVLPDTKILEYGKHLLYRKEDNKFIIKNNSVLPIKWKIRNAGELSRDFIIKQTEGILQRDENVAVKVAYNACKVGVIANQELIIDVYDEQCKGVPILTEVMLLSAECYDVLVDYSFDNPNDYILNYGNVKVRSPVTRRMFLLNRGKYNVYFKLIKKKSFPDPVLLQSFNAIPDHGVIPPNLKPVVIEFECKPTTSTDITNIPVYACTLVDDSENQTIVATFPINTTIKCVYNTFTLFPANELNFYIIPVGGEVMKEVVITNTGKSPFIYEIVLPIQYRRSPETPSIRGTDKNKFKNKILNCGNFTISTSDSLVPPKSSKTITIQCTATTADKYEEILLFMISDSSPEEAEGVPLKLMGRGAIPSLDFLNIDVTFKEHIIVTRMSDYINSELTAQCVFAEESSTLHFLCVIVNTSHAATIHLYNNGLVPCHLKMKLHYRSNNCNRDVLWLDKNETQIEPLFHKPLTIHFSPKAMTEYRAMLEINLKLTENESKSFNIFLLGEGVIPRIALISPPITRLGLTLLEFPLTPVESVTSQEIQVKNVSSLKAVVTVDVMRAPKDEKQQFWVASVSNLQRQGVNKSIQIILKPDEVRSLYVYFNPKDKERASCDIKLKLYNNPFEIFTILCKAEAFSEDITLKHLDMLPLDTDLDTYKNSFDGTITSSKSMSDSKRKIMSAPSLKKSKPKFVKTKKGKRQSLSTTTFDAETMSTYSTECSVLKYILDFGACELFNLKKRSITMVNNSKKVYKFQWDELEHIVVKPSAGHISPEEEKDLEVWFYTTQVVTIKKELLYLHLEAISDESLTSVTKKDTSWDCRQTITIFDHNEDVGVNERKVQVLDAKENKTDNSISKVLLDTTNLVVVCSAASEYSNYSCELPDEIEIADTFIYQSNKYKFNLENIGEVPFKIEWSFSVEDRFPVKTAPINSCDVAQDVVADIIEYLLKRGANLLEDNKSSSGDSNTGTLFSERADSNSIDTWMDVDLPFRIEPAVQCLQPKESCTFVITFSPTEAFLYNVRLKAAIDNLDPQDDAISCNLKAKSLIPYVHLAIEDSDNFNLRFNIRSTIAISPDTSHLQFNVLGTGCFKKNIKVINPTKYGYEFLFEMVKPETKHLIPIHCNLLKGYVEGGTSTEVTFTFAPAKPGVYETQWKFLIPKYSVALSLQVAGIVRVSHVAFQPPLLIIRNAVVGVTIRSTVVLKNNENENLNFNFKGNSLSLVNSEEINTVLVEPEKGVLRAKSETPVTVIYTPVQEGPLFFKIYCEVAHLTKTLTLNVNALGHAIKPTVSYSLFGDVYKLSSDTVTDIYLHHCQPPYEEDIPFTITNDGSTSFNYDWRYNTSSVRSYMKLHVEPNVGHVVPGAAQECVLHFTLEQLPVQTFPVTLCILDGPEYKIVLHVHIDKPACHFSCKECDFGLCIVDAPDGTYQKIIIFRNNDTKPVTLDFNCNEPELLVRVSQVGVIKPRQKINISITFRPKQLERYIFPLEFTLNSLCKETITILGEGIPLLFDLYEGCQRSINLGHIKLGKSVLRQIDVINHSKVPIDARFMFKYMHGSEDYVSADYRNTSVNSCSVDLDESKQLSIVEKDEHERTDITKNEIVSLTSSFKVTPKKCKIGPYEKMKLKILFKPVRHFKDLNVQLYMNVLHIEKPLVHLSGTVTGMSLRLSTDALQFGCLRRRGCKTLKVMIQNKGNSRARFHWQRLSTNEFTISPMKGTVEPQSNATVTVTFQPVELNPFVDVMARCNIENYKTLELALCGACMDVGGVENKVLHIECPVRESKTENLSVANPSDNVWVVHSEVSGGPFETLKEIRIPPNSTYDIPIHFKPKTMGRHESQILFYPFGESTLFVTVFGTALEPNPNGTIKITVPATEFHTEELLVHNITKIPETYAVVTEVVKSYPDKFKGHFEVKCPDTLQVCGRAATFQWAFVCFDECQIILRVIFVNEEAHELQYYDMEITVTPSNVKETLTFVSRERESVTQELVVQNPTSMDADFIIRCDKVECPDVLKIRAYSQATLCMVYSPLFVGEWQDRLEISNNVTGTITYGLVLKCLPADEKNVEIAAAIGSSIPLHFKVQNKSKSLTHFKVSVSHPSIIPEKVYMLEGQAKGKFRVMFEPTELGVQTCIVSFDSPDAGQFRFNVKGEGIEPQPQGPYDIQAGDYVIIPFKNVFKETRTFKVSVNREEFHVNTDCEKINSKAEVKLTVGLCKEPVRGWASAPTGCLAVQPLEPPEPKIQWIFFLQGRV